jgi:hypothetical protein
VATAGDIAARALGLARGAIFLHQFMPLNFKKILVDRS